MKMNLVRAPIVVGSLIAGTLVLFALVEAFRSSPRWDDHLLNAIGVLGGAVFISVTLRLASAVFRPEPGVPRRTKLNRIMWLIAFGLLIVIAISVAVFINDISFL